MVEPQKPAIATAGDSVSSFEAAWKSGSVGSFDDSVPAEARHDTDLLTELACIDIEHRLRHDAETRVEFYTQQFPQLAEDELVLLELVRTEYSFRPDKSNLDAAHYVARFPQLTRHIEMMFQFEFSQSSQAHSRGTHADWRCASCDSLVPGRATGATTCPECNQPITIGRYRLMERIGEGAFGIVFCAKDPKLDRTVAVKLPRSRQFLMPEETERFFRESRSVAQLDHAGIVRVFDTGSHDGVPYIVSEYVDGRSLSELLKERDFDFREAAQLVLQIANAVSHAHQRGVIHRDLKPSNIMTNSCDQTGLIVRVMDFGLARRSDTDVTVTLEGQSIGTPAYMSPEQARGDHAAIGEASDLYSLGVILFQLLCGEVPFRGNVQSLIQQVINDDPPSPSRFRPRIPRDLETICLKSIERDPGRRFLSVRHLADDLKRWLNGEPIHARPIGLAGHVWRWAARHPAISMLSTALLIAIITGFAGVTTQWLRAEQNAANEAQARRDEAIARQAAESETATANAVTDFVNEMLAVAEKRRKGRRATIVEAVDAGVARIDKHFEGRPLVEAEVRFTIGKIYRGLGRSRSIGQFRKSVKLFKEHLGREDDKTLLAMDRLAGALRSLGGTSDLPEALALREKVADAHVRKHGEESKEATLALNNLALVHDNMGQPGKALELYNRVLQIMDRMGDVPASVRLVTVHNIALAKGDLGNLKEEEESLRYVVEKFQALPNFQPNRDYLNSVHALALNLSEQERFGEAKAMFELSVTGRTEVFGPKHVLTLSSRRGYGRMLIQAKRFAEAQTIVEPNLSLHIEELGPAAELTISVRENWFEVLVGLGRTEDAISFLEDSITIAREIRGEDSSNVRRMEETLSEFNQ